MCLSKQKKAIDEHFTFAEVQLEKVDNYTYLVTEMSKIASFNHAQNAMADKATRTIFKL